MRSSSEYLRDRKAFGSRLFLMTASPHCIALRVNQHLGLFDEVVGSDSTCNLRGERKARAVIGRLGPDRFCYVGNDRTDLHVWKAAQSGVVVNGSQRLARLAARHTRIEKTIDRPVPTLKALIQALRPHQWVKNTLVFVPIITTNALGDLNAWVHALLAFVAFCLIASATYLINDLLDLKADRSHPEKRNRPFANGTLPIRTGMAIAPLLFIAGLIVSVLAGVWFFLLFYATVSLAYSLKLKEMALVDLFALAFLYTIRLFAGGVATGFHVSMWLLAFSGFLFFSLAAVKRIAELLTLRTGKEHYASRRGYLREDLIPLQAMGIGSSVASSLVMALYVQSQTASGIYASQQTLWALVPLFLFWQCRLWLLSARGLIREDPIAYTIRDRGSWAVGILMGITLVLANFHLPLPF